ncbi:MAG: hypothetical protein IT435_06845 [Phycisphaerales bacterium]|nr:hypothetical protein [Phycisphaerales bacterium]
MSIGTNGTAPTAIAEWNWEPQPKGQALINDLVAEFISRCPAAAELKTRMTKDSGTRFVDWIDHITLSRTTEDIADRLADAGFERRPHPGAPDCYVNEKGIFPAIVLWDLPIMRIAIKVMSVADFLFAQHIPAADHIHGTPGSQLRMVCAFHGNNAELWGVERHGTRSFQPSSASPSSPSTPLEFAKSISAAHHLELLRSRRRDFATDAQGFAEINRLVDRAIADLGRDWACDLFFESERNYWQSRNHAGQFQYARQQALGLGWANHDHHTYRSSRHCYKDMIAVLEKLGFHCRERFYAGAEAGWGAQVLEQSVTGITIFADVDMSPEELLGDFAHEGLPPRDQLGTIGLWCALHGEAILQAGMHHLECQFDWYALRDQMHDIADIRTMDPFTTFPYLRQAFTQGEHWRVAEKRIEMLLARHQITPAQAEDFRRHGALGSHLENLERNDGFKGFNQHGVSQIIAKTDPRRQTHGDGSPSVALSR